MCENEEKSELEPEPWKKRAPELEPHSWRPRAPELQPCSWKENLRNRSCVIFPTALQPWNNPHCSRAHTRSRVKVQQINCFCNNLQRFIVNWNLQEAHNSRLLMLTQWSISGGAFSPPLCCFAPLSSHLFFSPPCQSKSPPWGRFRPLWETLV